MAITPQEVERIAALARLGLTSEELKGATHNLSNVLDHFSTIQQIDTNAVAPSDAPSGQTNVTREDIPRGEVFCTAAELLEHAPAVQKEHIQVHAVFS